MKEIIIVSGGEFNGVVEYLRENKPADNKLFGVDRGALRLVDNGFTLDMAIGDFDSVTAEEFERIKQGAKRIHRTIPVKDDTDTELALKVAIETYPEEKYTLLGYAGGRMDHFLANLFMVTQPRFSNIIERLSLVDEQNTLTFLKPGKHKLASQLGFDYLSLIGIGKLERLSIKGAKYELEETDFHYLPALVSNEFLGVQLVEVSFTKGILLVMQTRDEPGALHFF